MVNFFDTVIDVLKQNERFFTAEGEPLSFGQGNTYIAITQTGSKVTWTA
jgi:hypothetical protein